MPRDTISNGFLSLRSTTGYYALAGTGTEMAQAMESSSAWGRARWGGIWWLSQDEVLSWGYIRLPSRVWPDEQGSPLFLWQLEFMELS